MRLSLLSEDKGPADFNYDTISKEMWRDKLEDAMEEFDIRFDTENDDAVSNRIIEIPQTQWEHAKCRFKCEIRLAGGDWQDSAYYFRCQLTDGYAKGLSKYGDPNFCFIPGKNDGNGHLIKAKSSGYAAPDHDDSNEDKSERKAWQALKKYLEKLVKDEITNVRSGAA